MTRLHPLWPVAVLALTLSCGGSTTDESPGPTGGVTSFSGNYGWTCPTGQNCQDVFDFTFTAGSSVTIQVNSVSDGSVSQLALYAPGVALGGNNMLTGTTKELRCLNANDCSLFTAGEQATNIAIPTTGTYRLGITRDWGLSCGASGTYHLSVTATKSFTAGGQTREDGQSAATGAECH